jgi:hypothetical protein
MRFPVEMEVEEAEASRDRRRIVYGGSWPQRGTAEAHIYIRWIGGIIYSYIMENLYMIVKSDSSRDDIKSRSLVI